MVGDGFGQGDDCADDKWLGAIKTGHFLVLKAFFCAKMSKNSKKRGLLPGISQKRAILNAYFLVW
jgi:hypothetical protein